MVGIDVFFVTNRNYLSANSTKFFGGRFNPDGVAALRFGTARFEVSGDKPVLIGAQVYPEQRPKNPGDKFEVSGRKSLLDALRDRMASGKHDTLVYIHGFNVSFVDALSAAARLAAEIPGDYNVVLFSWPSDGAMIPWMSYYSDREDARASGPALARAYLMLYEFVADMKEADRCERAIHVLAHSMGAYVLRQGVQAVQAKEPRKFVRLFDQVILAAADEDDDCFESDAKLRPLPSLARRVTVYFNRADRALLISDKTKANPDRLGSDGPRMMDLLPKKVNIVDCSRIAAAADPVVQHSYYINNPSIAADITATLANQEAMAIDNRDVTRPEYAFRIKG